MRDRLHRSFRSFTKWPKVCVLAALLLVAGVPILDGSVLPSAVANNSVHPIRPALFGQDVELPLGSVSTDKGTLFTGLESHRMGSIYWDPVLSARIFLDTLGFREQLLWYMQHPEVFGIDACLPFYGDDWEKLQAAAAELRVYDVTTPGVGALTLSELSLAPSARTLAELYNQAVRDAGVAALIILSSNGQISPNVVLGENFYYSFDPNSDTRKHRDLAVQNALLFHELLHYFYQELDIDLAGGPLDS